MKVTLESEKLAIDTARKIVAQWINHDQHRSHETELFSDGKQPDEVLIARSLLRFVATLEATPFFETAPTCPECCWEFEADYTTESNRIDCDCGCRFEAFRALISVPYEVME